MNDDLPGVPNGNNSPVTIPTAGNAPDASMGSTVSGGISGKEKEIGGFSSSELHSSGPGVEMELPKEVASAGIRTQPTSVKLPPTVQSMGVTQIGASAPLGNGKAVTLPLTDREIADGLKLHITSSFRWLAEWCMFQLKKIGSKK